MLHCNVSTVGRTACLSMRTTETDPPDKSGTFINTETKLGIVNHIGKDNNPIKIGGNRPGEVSSANR